MDKMLIDPSVFNFHQLSKRWGISLEDVEHYAISGDMRVHIKSSMWHFQTSDSWLLDKPVKKLFRHELIPVKESCLKQIFSAVHNPHADYEHFRLEDVLFDMPDYDSNVDDAEGWLDYTELLVTKEEVYRIEGKTPVMAVTHDDGCYVSPYMELMRRAIVEHGITAEYQDKVEFLQKWFLAQKIGDHAITKNEAKSMATLIRLPESKRGGNKAKS